MPRFPYAGAAPYPKNDASSVYGREGELSLLADVYQGQAGDKGKILVISAMAQRANDLRAFPPEMSILEFAAAQAEALFANWSPKRRAKLPIFVERFQAAATTRTKESALSAPIRIVADDPDSREMAGDLVQARQLTLYGQRWADAELRRSHEYRLADCPVTAPLLGA